MKTVIVGCGRFGSAIAEMLLELNYEVVVIDSNEANIDHINNTLDVLAVCANGADYDILDDIGMKDTDVFIACTASDETNVLASCYARNMGARHTIARFRSQEPGSKGYKFMQDQLGLDLVVSPDFITARDAFELLRFKKVKNVIINGATRITVFLTRMLLNAGIRVKIIDRDPSRCKFLSDNVSTEAIIINEDGPSYDILIREGIDDLDGFIAATAMDEENILTSLFAVEHNVPIVVTKVDKDSYSEIIQNLNLKNVISPRSSTAKMIVDFIKECHK